MGCHSGELPLPYSKGSGQGWGHLGAIRGLKYSGSSLHPVRAYLWTTSFIGKISPVYTQGRRDLSSSGVYRHKSWRLEGVRIWKLSRTYPGEKPSFTLRTHTQIKSNHAQVHTVLAGYALHPSEGRSLLTRVDSPLRSIYQGTMEPSLTQDFF